jgi:hypothetical protein
MGAGAGNNKVKMSFLSSVLSFYLTKILAISSKISYRLRM